MLAFIASHLFLFDQLGYKGECLSNFWFPEVYEATICARSFSLVVSVPLATLYREFSTSICWSVGDWHVSTWAVFSFKSVHATYKYESMLWRCCLSNISRLYVLKVIYRFLLTSFNVPMLLLCTFSCIATKNK